MSMFKRALIMIMSVVCFVMASSIEAKSLPLAVLKYVNNHIPKKPGHYEFPSKSKPYIGQSKNIRERIKQHLRSGKLSISDLRNVRWTKGTKSKPVRVTKEKFKIKVADIITGGGLANIQHAVKSNAKRGR